MMITLFTYFPLDRGNKPRPEKFKQLSLHIQVNRVDSYKQDMAPKLKFAISNHKNRQIVKKNIEILFCFLLLFDICKTIQCLFLLNLTALSQNTESSFFCDKQKLIN